MRVAMYLRLIQSKFKSEYLSIIRQVYDTKIIPELMKMPGCLCVCLVKSDFHQDEGISLSLWDSQEHAEAYAKSGQYEKYLMEIKPYLSDSSEWKIQLSDDFTIEYQPVQEEPVLKAYTAIAQGHKKIPLKEDVSLMCVRILSLKVQTGKMDEFNKIYRENILPALNKVKGCRYAFVTGNAEDKNEALSVTIWDSKQDAIQFETNGTFDRFINQVRHTLSELLQWKMGLEKESSQKVVTSDDMSVKYYKMVTGKSIK
jgi:heme-degrading monooxygenase HmoA